MKEPNTKKKLRLPVVIDELFKKILRRIKTGKEGFMVFYISLFLILWLAAGFAVGMKQVYVDQLFDKTVIERLEKEANDHGQMIKQRALYIAAVTLSGFISVYYEMKTIPQRRNIRKIEKNIMKLNQAKKRRMKRK